MVSSKKPTTQKTQTPKTQTPKIKPPRTPRAALPPQTAPKLSGEDLLAKRMGHHPQGLARTVFEMKTTHNTVVTRQMAQAWLKNLHPNQRERSPTHADTYRLKIEEGSWRPTAQGFIFDWYGRLMDGQHRLAGFLATDPDKHPTLLATVTTGCDPEDFTELDGDATPRKIKDLLAGAKVPNAAQAAPAFKAFVDFAKTHQFFQENPNSRGQRSFGHRTATRIRASRKDVVRWILENQDVVDHVTNKTKTTKTSRMGPLRPPGIFAGFYLWVALENRVQADKFFGPLIGGAGLKENSPIYVLRRTFELLREEKAKKTVDFARSAMIILAWNAWLRGETMEMGDLNHNEKLPWPMRLDVKPLDW